MSRQSLPPPPPSSATLPIRTRCVVGAEGIRSIALVVFCPRRSATIAVDVCERCSHLERIDARGDQASITCDAGVSKGHEEPAGGIARATVVCVRRETPLDALDADELRSPVIPVVDELDRYVGAIVRGRSSAPSLRRDERAWASDANPTAEDALEQVPAVNEHDDAVTAAARMTSSRARCAPIVNDEGVVVGMLDDLALLASVARAHRASEVMKRCACGHVYTRAQWWDLPLVGVMSDEHGEPMELRNCGRCGSTIVVPAASAASSEVA